MLKVKDTSRLKAFGFSFDADVKDFVKHIVDINNNYATIFVNSVNGKMYVCGDASNELLETIFDLQAANIIERVPG